MPPIAAAALLGKRNAGAQARDGEFEHVTTRVTICASTCEEHSSVPEAGRARSEMHTVGGSAAVSRRDCGCSCGAR